MEYKIIPLPKEEWKGVPVPIRYTTEEYYSGADGEKEI